MTHRKHYKRTQGELVATTASLKEKPQKCQKAFENRKTYKKAAKEYVNVPISITIGNYVTAQALIELKKTRTLKYFATLLSIRKELTAFEASEYLKKGFKVEIVEEQKYSLTILFINNKHRIKMKEKTANIISYVLLALVFIGMIASMIYHISNIGNTKENTQQQSQYLQENEFLFFPEWVDSIVIVDNDSSYYANIYYMDTLVLGTSVEEAESLIAELDTIYSRYLEDTLELEEALGAITDNSLITKIGDFYLLELDWIKKQKIQ